MTDLGFFQTATKPRAVAGPVTLKPYVAREPLVYRELSKEEIIAGCGGTLVFDVECFANYFLIAFKHARVGLNGVMLFEFPIDKRKLKWIAQNYTLVGFNSLKYDVPLLWGAVSGLDMEKLKQLSDNLISGARIKDACSFQIPVGKNIDLINVCPLHGSLKLYGARLHAARIQDVPWSGARMLEDWQIGVTRDYCINDLALTELIYGELGEQLALRRSLGEEYGLDFMSKGDAQIAEDVITHELRKISGRARRSAVRAGEIHKFVPPANISFQSSYMKDVLRVVCDAEFVVDAKGYLVCPEAVSDMEVRIGDGVYRMGIGGLHSSETKTSWVADDEFELYDRDVGSYYPAIFLNCGLTPHSLGEDFLTVFRGLVNRRMDAKQRRDISVSENLKVSINGAGGKLSSPFSILYSPQNLLQMTVCGQLYLLMLIEALENVGVHVISANTDGIVSRCPLGRREDMLSVIGEWEKVTGFVTEETQYRSLHSRDVNAYLAIKMDGSVKGKNVFYDPWRAGSGARELYWRFQKNPTCQICVEAVERFLVDGVTIEKTIRECKDITRFIAVKNVTGGAHKDGNYLGKVVRWYYARSVEGTINYVSNGRIVGDTLGAKPLMDLPNSLPDDVDYSWYVKRCEDMLREVGS